ncbi:MAG: hypothetical protein Aurels2KO_39540 [Aureliella sp.]
MIRPIEFSDRDSVLRVAVESGLFEEAEVGSLAESLDAYLAASNVKNKIWLVDDDNGVVAVAFLAHEQMTIGTWNMLMLAVHRDEQGKGRGSALVKHSTDLLSLQGNRILLVETAGVEDFEKVRQFYRQNGFTKEGVIRNFYEEGVDKVIFQKTLNTDQALIAVSD